MSMTRPQTIFVLSAALVLLASQVQAEADAGPPPTGPSFLEPADHAILDRALRWAGLSRADLQYARDYVNYGVDEPVDRWRLPAAQQALEQPLLLPDLAARWSLALSEDLGGAGRMPGWTGFGGIVTSQLGETTEDACADLAGKTAAIGIVVQSLASEQAAGRKWSRRESRDLRERIDSRLDLLLGGLLAQARVATCRVDAALATISDEQRAAVVAALEQTLWGDPEVRVSEDDERQHFEVLTGTWDSLDRAALLAAGQAWSDVVLVAAQELWALPEEAWPAEPLILPTALGEVWIGSRDSNAGSGDPVLLIDPGGDDHWRIAPQRDALPSAGFKAARAWIDLGGSDVWRGGQGGPGGALFSVAAGVDLSGDDIYRSGRLSQGAAAFGFSTWLDQGGADRYLGTVAVQGFAAFGAAILRDAGTDGDLYQAGFLAQGASHSGGVAVLHDGGGPDRYVLGGTFEDNPNRLSGHYSSCGQGFSIGMRPYAGGGVALLLDESGHDQYIGGLWVQGSSYWHSLAALVDRGGNDLYSATQYSQGSGIHLSSAGLFDGGGDDRYLLPNLGQGSGHDLAVSWLIDASGDDLYTGSNLLQGATIANAASFFLDRSGDDTYASRTANSRGQASDARGFGAVGVFIDSAGDDRYLDGESARPIAGLTEVRGSHGIFVDHLPPSSPEVENEVEVESEVEVEDEVEVPASQSMGARELLLRNVLYIAPQADTDAAVERLAGGGSRVLKLLLPLTSDALILRSYTIERVVQKLIAAGGSEALQEVAAAIARAALSGEPSAADARARWHLSWLGKVAMADPATAGQAVSAAQELRSHPAWRVRKAAWTLVASIASLDGLSLADEDRVQWEVAASRALSDDLIVEVRAAAARTLSALGGPGVATGLAEGLREDSFELRDSAEAALAAITARSDGVAVARALFPIASGQSEAPAAGRDAALRLLGATGHRDAWELLRAALDDRDPATRAAALAGALALRPRGLKAELALIIESEQHPTVRLRLSEALALDGLR
jgi:hypothetical protein